MKVLIDNGHGLDTKGKCSPHVIGTGISGEAVIDGRFREAMYSRLVAKGIVAGLKGSGIDAELLTPENWDVSLQARVYRANQWCKKLGPENVLVVSIHTNASGDGEHWMPGHGWEIYTSKGRTKSDEAATCIGEAAKSLAPDWKMRFDYSDGDLDKEAAYYILTKTRCPAVLSENGFHDNLDDVRLMTSAEGLALIVEAHVKGIAAYVEKNA